MKFITLLIVNCSLLIVPCFSQSAHFLETLLEREAVSYQDAALLVLDAAELINGSIDQIDPADVFRFAMENNMLPRKAESNNAATYEGLSLLVMRAFGFRGGLFYSIFQNPHYAYREMVYKNIIQGYSDPKMIVTGEELLFIVNRAMFLSSNN